MSQIVAAYRSAVVPRNQGFANLALHELTTPLITALLMHAGLAGEDIDEVILGNALGAGGNPARITSLAAGLPERIAGLSIDRQCCSGLDALILADALIESGQANIVIAGGVESYSRAPLRAKTFADGRPPEPYQQADFTPWPGREPLMHNAAAELAQKFQISRQQQDAWAVQSHAKARANSKRLKNEIITINNIDTDVFTRALTETHCRKAKTLVDSISVANTAAASDGAAMVLMVSDNVANTLTLPSLHLITGCSLGANPMLPGIAPIAAIESVLDKAAIDANRLDVVEIMEAYAVQALLCQQQAHINSNKVNMAGGGLARGHAVGASGAINAVRLFHEMQYTQSEYGLAAIAAAGGIGSAIILHQNR